MAIITVTSNEYDRNCDNVEACRVRKVDHISNVILIGLRNMAWHDD